ncbi:MAG: hypothetical protein ACE37B_11810 [Ilumatobacter sp.]|uniref:hypothetical protein n=1 Tax=Ilumatobacter sp. TaxID=1967498 RepID=UPI00391C467E
MKLTSDNQAVSLTRSVLLRHRSYQSSGNSSLGRQINRTRQAEVASYELGGEVDHRAERWEKLIAGANERSIADLRAFLSKVGSVNERFGWCCTEAKESFELLSTDKKAQQCRMDQLEDFLNEACREFRAQIDASVGFSRTPKKLHRKEARRDLAAVLVAVRLLAAAERNSSTADELLGTAQSLLRR